MTYVFGPTSLARRQGLHPDLIAVLDEAIKITKQDFMILQDSVRTLKRQQELYAKGRSVAELRAKGIPSSILAQPGERKVTWTLNSKHRIQPSGYSEAVDLCPYPVDWDDLSKFDAIAKAMFDAAKKVGVKLRWGADWDQDGKPRERGESDSPHFELA